MKTTYLFMLCLFIQFGLKAQTEITWTNAKNITVKGEKLIKNGDVKAWWNAGIASEEHIGANTDGWVKAAVTKPKGAKILGLSSQNKETTWDTVEYGLYVMGNGTIQILEKGKIIFTSKVKVNKGDLIQVERKSGEIRYKKNNDVVYTSKKKSTSALFVDISMYAAGAEFSFLSMSPNAKKGNKEVAKDLPLNFKTYGNRIVIEHFTDADLAAIQKMEKKEKLDFKLGREISQTEFDAICSNLTWIRKFDFGSAFEKIESIAPLQHLTQLEELSFSYLRRTDENPFDLSALENAKNLRFFEGTGISFINANALKDMNNLEEFKLNTGNLDSYSFLKGKSKITNLQIPNNTDNEEVYAIIGAMEALEELHLLAGDKGVTQDNIAALKGLKSLKWLYIPGETFAEGVLDITALGNMTALENLFISKHKVTDLSPLFTCKNLSFVEVHKSTTEEQVKRLKTVFPELEVKVSKF